MKFPRFRFFQEPVASTLTASIIPLALLATCVCTMTANADDWPRWLGPKMDGVWHETGMINEFPESGANVVWRQKIGAGYAGPSVVGDHLFVMDRTIKEKPADEKDEPEEEKNTRKAGELLGGERIRCLNVATGETVWSHQYDCPYSIAYPTGPRCTPTVDGEHIYSLGAMGNLLCLKKDTGDVVWENELTKSYETKPPLWGYASHPLVVGESLIVPVGGKGSGVVAFNKTTGEELWKSVTTLDICYAPLVMFEPADAEKQMIFWHADGVTSLNPDSGEEYWAVKFPEERNASQTAIATPTLCGKEGDQLLISEFYKGSLLLEIGSNPPSVIEKWRQFETNPKLDKAMNSMMATPVVKDGHAYGVAYNGRGQGVLRCIDLETGEMTWNRDDWMSEKPLMFATAFIIANEDKYFIFDDIGELIIGKLSPSGFEELDRAKLLEPTSVARGRDVVWSHPAYANGKMFVRNDEEIICVDLKQSSDN